MTTTRRNFLGGLALLAVSPVAIKNLDLSPGEPKEIEVAQLADMQREINRVGPLGTSGIRAALVARINAHWALFGEPPKALFLSQREAMEYEQSLRPQLRYEVTRINEAGYQNMLFRGIPVISTDHQLLIPEDQLHALA